ncbi:MAG: glutamate-5-semialdehyde dehydrogenase [Myxococcales bacterium]|nr:glutamate-5-semialdehyde dehydrogenase [Myxococcales bacterium]MCB9644435.1 glutamate-5-semialdehyde dehydrogenase [Myxococcales bacterium]
MSRLESLGRAARQASRQLAMLSTTAKDQALLAIASALEEHAPTLLAANQKDVAAGREKGLSSALLDRLLLNDARIAGLANDTRSVVALPDPVGVEIEGRVLPNGLRLSRRRIPIGVLGVIYEARPNVTIDVAVLALKTGNAVILRGGSETLHSNLALVRVIRQAIEEAGLPKDAVQYIEDPDRALVAELLQLDQYVDMIIPRGGASLHELCRKQSTIPVITGGIGICHIFVDQTADLERAVDIVENAKVQRPSVCNALDTLLVHHSVAKGFIPAVASRLQQSDVLLKVTPEVEEILQASGATIRRDIAGPDDFDQEWLSLTLGVRLVKDLDEAIEHIHQHSSEHSDSILTNNFEHATRFVQAINSAAVYVNASTRFTDGSQFGLGAEVAISTQKLHARGPMGLEELTTYKWIVFGQGHIRP